MPDWSEILDEIREVGGAHDVVRKRKMDELSSYTGRNTIAYYSGWLQKPDVQSTHITDDDKNGFMTAIHKLDRAKGLDLILHTPGGEIAATESLVDYLRSMFGMNIRAIIPQLAMSAGTMIACSCEKIVMGKQSSLGPIDPQLGGIAAHGILEEISTAHEEVKADPTRAIIWQPILQRYNPTLVGECQKAITWSESLVKEWLKTNMFKGLARPAKKINKIIQELGDHALNLSHARHMSVEKCEEIGLEIESLEDDHTLQDLVLSVHHAFMQTLSATNACKIIENHIGAAFIQAVKSR